MTAPTPEDKSQLPLILNPPSSLSSSLSMSDSSGSQEVVRLFKELRLTTFKGNQNILKMQAIFLRWKDGHIFC